jgi:hypothetical protein
MPHNLLSGHLPHLQKLAVRDQITVISINCADHLSRTLNGSFVWITGSAIGLSYAIE